MKTLLLVAPCSPHTDNFLKIAKEIFREIVLITDNSPGVKYDNVIVETINYRTINPLKILRKIKYIQKIIRRYKPDIIHLLEITRLAWLVVRSNKKDKVPVVATPWGSDVLLMPKKNFLYRFLVYDTLKKVDYLTADTPLIIEEAKKMVSVKKCKVIFFPVECVENEKMAKEKIVYSNRLHYPLYNIDRVIRYFADWVKSDESNAWRLVIAATGSETESLKKLSENLGIEKYVTFTGWNGKEENLSWYRRSSVFISIPSSDGTSVSVLEALYHQCKVILSDLPANRYLEKIGCKVIFEEENTNPFSKLRYITDDDLQKNKNIIEKYASFDNIKRTWQETYQELKA
ncbi:MAG: capsular polysaccharide biosynthesis protein [Vicingaceae bacterium]|nr:MAG: capsular polysaccharide biosynthesis protein [Vicingaceae bacterium]